MRACHKHAIRRRVDHEFFAVAAVRENRALLQCVRVDAVRDAAAVRAGNAVAAERVNAIEVWIHAHKFRCDDRIECQSAHRRARHRRKCFQIENHIVRKDARVVDSNRGQETCDRLRVAHGKARFVDDR